MIITLKGADFSASNIGNLYRWNIYYSLGTGVTHSGATSVLKGESYSVNITIAEGYELSEAGASVTMNGELLSNAITIVNNNIAIDIPEVTGTLVISIPTVKTATNLIDISTMSSALRYSPGAYNIVGASGTKYGLLTIELEPNSTYYLKLDSGYTGGLFSTEPVKGAKTTVDYNLNATGKGTHTITTDATHYWIAFNIATIDVSDEITPLTPTNAWLTAFLYKAE